MKSLHRVTTELVEIFYRRKPTSLLRIFCLTLRNVSFVKSSDVNICFSEG